LRNEFFDFGKIKFAYWEPFQDTERRFEIPLLKYFIDKFKDHDDLMEVGAVSNWHFPVNHKIYDASERYVINEFAENLKYSGKIVVSISTIEHIGKPDYGFPINPYRALTVLNMMLEAKYYLITWPIGHNTLLDYYARNVVTGVTIGNVITVGRLDIDNNWVVNKPNFYDYKYATPFPVGNGVIVITNIEELLP
jgi:hypothetical protein